MDVEYLKTWLPSGEKGYLPYYLFVVRFFRPSTAAF